MSTPDLDPAAIMAKHENHIAVGTYCVVYKPIDPDSAESQEVWATRRCLPYRLAEDLADLIKLSVGYITERDRLAAENAALREQLDETADQRDEQTALADRYWQETDEAMRARNALREQVQRVRAAVDKVDQTKSASIMVGAIYAALDGDQPTGEAE